MGSGLTSKNKKLNYTMPNYSPSIDEVKWRNFCIKKNLNDCTSQTFNFFIVHMFTKDRDVI